MNTTGALKETVYPRILGCLTIDDDQRSEYKIYSSSHTHSSYQGISAHDGQGLIVTERKRDYSVRFKNWRVGGVCCVGSDCRDLGWCGIRFCFLWVTWRMIRYDGKVFTEDRGMEEQKDTWVENNSVIVDCVYATLQNGGIVKQDMVVFGS